MDQIIEAVDEIYNNDSVYNIVRNEYFPWWNRCMRFEECEIIVRWKNDLGDTMIITPTSKEIEIIPSIEDILYLNNFIEFQFIYYDKKIYLNPTIEVWHYYQ